MKTEVLIEMAKFCERIGGMRDEIIAATKDGIVPHCSLYTDYDCSGDGVREIHKTRVVESISFNVILSGEYLCAYPSGKKSEDAHYYLSVVVTAENCQIHSGTVMMYIWKYIADKFRAEEFPNFIPPRFTDDGKQIIGGQ